MWSILLMPLVASAQGAPSPYLLPIGASGTVQVAPGQIVQTRTGRVVEPSAVAATAEGTRWIYLGESHDVRAHRAMMASILDELVSRGRDVAVGLEMFTRPKQDSLDPWTLGRWSVEEFVERSDWKGQWGFDFDLYRPLFDAVRRHRLPMVALNVPREWVRTVGREGLQGLSPEQRADLPADIHLGNAQHRQVFEALMGGHPMTGARGENIYAAQVVWDEGMADSALRYVRNRSSLRLAFVVVAGSGHVMYDQGINYRIQRRIHEGGISVVMIESPTPVTVSRGIADFVFVSPPTGPIAPETANRL
jgi:uncharacterized iron-regulated protein